ncbi:FadR/GntR family transcriptional regulator [Jeotgalibacillus proteolyticus]|uniref:FadR family transcriptional regulator n=1 Tax=Jeotgalibacillus proteolyticus TaxID=2082395 RepID=A0A2S5GD01_9BACL|nr:FadR/GntR family transcriptional regulator [Jeotgalibacillus proteolyticus]PPA70828.1 FadR family transcriptional regulator [Jeotgalibacillus proteolyticus]
MKPIKKKSRLYQEVINEIFTSISKENLKPGDKLPSERTIADLLEVSRTTVKEAISVLEANGIVQIRPGVGLFLVNQSKQVIQQELFSVLNPQKNDLAELVELRQAIEGDAAYYAAKRMTDEQREVLIRTFNNLVHAEEKGELAIEEDYAFHGAILKAANNTIMKDLMEVISQKVYFFIRQNRMETLLQRDESKLVMKEHRLIFEAIMSNNPEEAKKAMWNHLHSIKIRHHYI